MAKIRIGQPAPDSTVQTLDGGTIALSSAWSGDQHAHLIFLRHLA